MTHIPIKHKPQLPLLALLKRRKTTFKAFLIESGITTYTALKNYCDQAGVAPPSQKEFLNIEIPVSTVQTEGIVVIEPSDLSEDEEPFDQVNSFQPTKKRKKKN
jgi:hypothetical protein